MTTFPRLVVAIATCFSVSGYGNPLTVTTWGGSHGDVVSAELLSPFSTDFGIPVKHKLTNQSQGGELTLPGIVELSLSEAIDACERSEILILPADRLSDISINQKVIQDFVPNTLQPCAIGHSVWSTVVAFDNNRYGVDEKPHLITDLFNVEFYPGKRVLRRSPRVLVEWALVASGIPPAKVYEALDNTEHSWALINEKLKSIEQHIVWVESDAEAIDLIRSGHAAFAMLSSDSLVRDSKEGAENLGVLWDAAVTELSLWAIPSEAPNPEVSWNFIRYATSVLNSGKVASFFGYSPVRYSTLTLMDREHQMMLPSWPENQRNLLWGNSSWWQARGGFIADRFTQWVLNLDMRPELTLVTALESISSNEIDSSNNLSVSVEKFFLSRPAPFAAIGKRIN